MQAHHLNSVIGFSGTPYLSSAEKIVVADRLTIANPEISNIVYYYPLVDGLGNFLKKPTVKIADGLDRLQIVEKGIREFFDHYKDTVYSDGTCAKLGIYCSTIETLELLIAEATESFEILPLEQDLDLLRNILYSGVWQRYTLKQEKEKRKEGAHGK